MKRTIHSLIAMIILTISLCGCVSKSEVVGVWRLEEKSHYGYNQYECFREDGTGDNYRRDEGYYNGFIWKIDGNYILTGITKYNEAYKKEVKDGKMYDLHGKLIATKISDDPNEEIEE